MTLIIIVLFALAFGLLLVSEPHSDHRINVGRVVSCIAGALAFSVLGASHSHLLPVVFVMTIGGCSVASILYDRLTTHIE